MITEILLTEILKTHCPGSAWQWLESQLDDIQHLREDLTSLDLMLAMARRKMGDKLLSRSRKQPSLAQWNISDAARVLILSKVISTGRFDAPEVIRRSYQQGDEYEKEAILKGLLLLDPDGQLLDMAADACRTNVLTMMAAIALENSYPARFFSEHSFNQMVLKLLFLDLDISRVSRLDTRLNPSLSRMGYDYMCERLAARREIPFSIWLAIRIEDVGTARELFYQSLISDKEKQRFYVTKSLVNQSPKDHSIRDVLLQHLQTETSEAIRLLISKLESD